MNLKQPAIFDVYEGEAPIAWDQMNPRPALAILKASGKFYDGYRRQDYEVENYAAQCRALNIPIGLYHFLLPNNIAEQAELFLGVWNKLGGADIPPIVDVECDSMTWNVGKSAWTNQIKVFLDLVEAGTGKKPIIYSSLYYWSFTTCPAWANDYGHWVAYYPNYPDNFTEPTPGMFPTGWIDWDLWQYNDKGRSNGFLANDLNIASPAFLQSIGQRVSVPDVYVIRKSLSEVEICFTQGTGDPKLGLTLLSVVDHAANMGAFACMNGGCGFDYTDADHAFPKSAGFEQINGIPYARRMIDQNTVNPNLDTVYLAPWSVLGFDASNVYLIVTDGCEGQFGFTQAEAAQKVLSLGCTSAFLMDSGHSTQLERDGVMLCWPYQAMNERVPQAIGLKAKTTNGGFSMKGVARAITNIKATEAGKTPAVTQLLVGQYAYGNLVGSAQSGDLVGFSHIYRSGTITELGCVCKAYAGNLTLTNESETVTPPPPPPPSDDVVLKSWQITVTINGVDKVFSG